MSQLCPLMSRVCVNLRKQLMQSISALSKKWQNMLEKPSRLKLSQRIQEDRHGDFPDDFDSTLVCWTDKTAKHTMRKEQRENKCFGSSCMDFIANTRLIMPLYVTKSLSVGVLSFPWQNIHPIHFASVFISAWQTWVMMAALVLLEDLLNKTLKQHRYIFEIFSLLAPPIGAGG